MKKRYYGDSESLEIDFYFCAALLIMSLAFLLKLQSCKIPEKTITGGIYEYKRQQIETGAEQQTNALLQSLSISPISEKKWPVPARSFKFRTNHWHITDTMAFGAYNQDVRKVDVLNDSSIFIWNVDVESNTLSKTMHGKGPAIECVDVLLSAQHYSQFTESGYVSDYYELDCEHSTLSIEIVRGNIRVIERPKLISGEITFTGIALN